MECGEISQPTPRPARTTSSTAFRFKYGSAPGWPQQMGQIWEFGSAPKAVEQRQNNLDSVFNWTWTSRPMTGSRVTFAYLSCYGCDGHLDNAQALCLGP